MTNTYIVISEGRIEEHELYRAPPRRHSYRTDVENLDPARPVKEGICEPARTQAVGLVGCCVNASNALTGDPHVTTMMEMRHRSDMPTA
jgi:hypothetical protein